MTIIRIGSFTAKTAIVGLSLFSFALFAPSAQAQAIRVTSATSISFSNNLTLGSSGTDVSALQTWLASKGYAIPAGATGYFGAQTRAALIQYQLAAGITPAAGYFGPITRAKVSLATTLAPVPAKPVSQEDEDGRDDAEDSIADAEDAFDDAKEEIEEAEDDDKDLNDAEEFIGKAEDALDDALDAFDDKDYEDAIELAERSEKYVEEALDEIEEQDDEDEEGDQDESDTVETSAKTTSVDGADNDYATFEIEIGLSPFNQDLYLAKDTSVSFDYQIEDSNGNVVSSQTSLNEGLRSTADSEGSYYVASEGESERYTLSVIFDPSPSGEGMFYRLQLLAINYNNTASAPDQEWIARPSGKYETKSVYIGD
ncbi:MAG: peptidoglycan-binding protein [Patescibacteria group bacterium]